jgi:uncharacterized surface protein with fasciclin (FAS1) repeats
MKNFLLITLFCFCVYHTKAQVTTKATTTTQAAAKTPDTAKKTIPKHIKTRMVSGTQMSSANDVIENIAKSKDYSTFTNSIAVSGLDETFKSRGPITVFAPTNEAFQKLTPGLLDTLLKPEHNAELTKLLTYHVINGKLTSKDIARQISASNGEATFTTLSGSKLRAKINGDRNIVLIDESGNESVISQFDIEQNNGIIDVVTALLIPKNNN